MNSLYTTLKRKFLKHNSNISEDLLSRIDFIKSYAKELLHSLKKNNFVHSKNIESRLDNIIPDNIKEAMIPGEIFILIYSIYLHDIGYLINKSNHSQASYNEIINNYQKYMIFDKYQAEAIAIVCKGHGDESAYPIEEIDKNFGVDSLDKNNTLNLRFLAALLRLGDDIDNAYTRVMNIPDQRESVRNLVRNLISFIESSCVSWRIYFHCNPSNFLEWKKLQSMKFYIQDRLEEIRPTLEKNKLFYWKIELKPNLKKFEDILNQNRNKHKYDAIKVLAEAKDKEAVDSLINLTKNRNKKIYESAMWALSKIGDRKSIHQLISLLQSPTKRAVAIEALAKIGAPAIYDLLKVIKVKDSRKWYWANSVLGKIGEIALNPLIEIIKELDIKDEKYYIDMFVYMDPWPKKKLLLMLKDENRKVRLAAVKIIKQNIYKREVKEELKKIRIITNKDEELERTLKYF